MNATSNLHITLREARLKKGLSQNDVAKELNISRQAVSRWENGRTVPSPDTLSLLGELYEISVDELLGCKAFVPEETAHIEEVDTSEENENTILSEHLPAQSTTSFNREYMFFMTALVLSCFVCGIGLIVSGCIFVWTYRNRSDYKLILMLSITCFLINLNNVLVFLSQYLY